MDKLIKNKRLIERLFVILLITYILFMIQLLFFKYVSIFEIFNDNRTVMRSINIVPFKTIKSYYFSNYSNTYISNINILGNIGLFLPLGVYFKMYLKDKGVFKCFSYVFLTSLLVEIFQYILGLGVTDIDDLILNSIGGLIGILGYKILSSILKDDIKIKVAILGLAIISLGLYLLWVLYLVIIGARIHLFRL